MPAYHPLIDPLLAQGALDVAVPSTVPKLSSTGSFVVSGLAIEPMTSGLYHVAKYVGEKNVPHDIHRLRRYTFEVMRRMGTPVIIKRMLTDRDVFEGYADPSPNFDSVYGQTRNEDLLSYGIGYVSKLKSENEYIDTSGSIFTADINPGNYAQAPMYRGYGPGYLTYLIEPDAAEDFYKHSPEGVFVRVQEATAQAPWWPDINDNDLIIHATLDDHGEVVATNERYQAKMTNPVSMRGLDRLGRREYSADTGNRHVINQQFSMSLVPFHNVLHKVDIDR